MYPSRVPPAIYGECWAYVPFYAKQAYQTPTSGTVIDLTSVEVDLPGCEMVAKGMPGRASSSTGELVICSSPTLRKDRWQQE